MQLPSTAASDSDSDDGSDIELYQVPECVLAKGEGSGTATAGFADSSTQSTEAPAALRSSSSSTQTAEDPPSDDLSSLTQLFAALGPSSAPLSSTSSASHLPAAALERTSSTSSSSSSDSDSSTSSAAHFRSLSLNTNSSASTSAAALAGVHDTSAVAGAVLSLDACPLADSDLDDLIRRLSASTADVPGTTGSTSTAGSTAAGICQQPAGRSCLGRTSSSDLSSDNSSGSIHNDQDGRSAMSPHPVHTNTNNLEPRWLKQQRQQQCSAASSQEGSTSSPSRKQPIAGKVWQPPSTVVDLRSPTKTATAATQPEAPGHGRTISGAPARACGTAAVQAAAISRAAWACDSGSESDSSEEEWQQLRQMQRARAGVGAAGVQS